MVIRQTPHLKTSLLRKPLVQHCLVPLYMRRQLVTILKCTSLCRVWAKMSPPPTRDDDDDDHFSSHFLLVKPSLSTSLMELLLILYFPIEIFCGLILPFLPIGKDMVV